MLRMRYPRHLGGLVFLPLLLASCSKPESLAIGGSTSNLRPGDAVQLHALLTEKRCCKDVTQVAQWNSSDSNVGSVALGLLTVHRPGEVTVSARFEQAQAQRHVHVAPPSGLNGAYTLTLGGGVCPGTMPAELRQRSYAVTALLTFNTLEVRLPGAALYGAFVGPNVKFELYDYDFYGPSLSEVLPDGKLLVITGSAVTSPSPAGLVGTLTNGAMTLYPPGGPLSTWPLDKSNAIAVCASSSHVFSMTR